MVSKSKFGFDIEGLRKALQGENPTLSEIFFQHLELAEQTGHTTVYIAIQDKKTNSFQRVFSKKDPKLKKPKVVARDAMARMFNHIGNSVKS